MHIIGIISFMNIGGAQSALLRLAGGLGARGHTVEVWSLYEKSASNITDKGIYTFVKKRSLSFYEYLKVFFQLVTRLKKTKPDAVIGFLPLGNVFGLTAATLAGVPRRIASQRSPGTSYGGIIRFLDRMLGTTAIYHSIVCVSESVLNSFSGYPRSYTSKLCVIYNGMDRAPAGMDRSSARDLFKLPHDKPLLVTVGRLEKEKNNALVVKILEGLKQVHVAMAGNGRELETLRILASSSGVINRISFLGNLDPVSVSNLLRAADIFIHPSFYEGQSNSLLEAMHAGLPVIASDIPAQRESLTDEHGELAGILLPPDDIKAWENAVRLLLNDPARAEKLGRSAMDLVLKRFPLSLMVDKFEKVLTD